MYWLPIRTGGPLKGDTTNVRKEPGGRKICKNVTKAIRSTSGSPGRGAEADGKGGKRVGCRKENHNQ